jgi:hypothetical protein
MYNYIAYIAYVISYYIYTYIYYNNILYLYSTCSETVGLAWSHIFVNGMLFVILMFFLAIFGQAMSLPFASSVNLLSDLVHSCNDYVANYIRMHAIYCPKVEWRWALKSRWVLQMLSGSKSCACNRTSWFVDCVRRVGSALSGKASSILFWMCLNAAYRNTRFFKRMSHHLTCLVLFDSLWKSRLLSGAPEVLLCSIAKTIHTGIETRSHLIFIFYPWKIIHYSLFISFRPDGG